MKHQVTLLDCSEDDSLVYLVGGWNSIDQHVTEWIPSSINQGLLSLLGDDVDVKWMFHLSCEPSDLVERVIRGAIEQRKDVIEIGRYVVEESVKDEFERVWKANVRPLEESVNEDAPRDSKREGGWRLDQGYDREQLDQSASQNMPTEFVSFMKRLSMQKDHVFAEAIGFQENTNIRSLIVSEEIRHGTVWHIAIPRDS